MAKLIIEITGNIGQDAEVKDINGNKYLAFSVAYSEKYKDSKGQEIEKTTWVSCLKPIKGEQSGLAKYLTKGSMVEARGSLRVSAYINTSNGLPQASINMTVRDLDLLRSTYQEPNQGGTKERENVSHPGNETAGQNQSQAPQIPGAIAPEKGDDLPF